MSSPTTPACSTECHRSRHEVTHAYAFARSRAELRRKHARVSGWLPARGEERAHEREELLRGLRTLLRVLLEHAEDEAVAGFGHARVPRARSRRGLAEVLLH